MQESVFYSNMIGSWVYKQNQEATSVSCKEENILISPTHDHKHMEDSPTNNQEHVLI